MYIKNLVYNFLNHSKHILGLLILQNRLSRKNMQTYNPQESKTTNKVLLYPTRSVGSEAVDVNSGWRMGFLFVHVGEVV